jgi:hypothetical protein
MALVLLLAGLIWKSAGLANPRAFMRSWALKLLVAAAGWVFTNLHLRLIDPLYLKRGRLDRLLRPDA